LRQTLPLVGLKLQLPLYSQKQTQLGSRDRSEKCQEQTNRNLFISARGTRQKPGLIR
jgi:hypothetical protein